MSEQANWTAINEQHLKAAVLWIRLRLQELACSTEQADPQKCEKKDRWFRRARRTSGSDTEGRQKETSDYEAVERARQEMSRLEETSPPPALSLLTEALGLSPFDKKILLLCAAMELDSRIAELCAKVHGNPNKPYPTFALAFALFADPDWAATAPHSPLRRWRLLEINRVGAQPLTGAALIIDERIVNFLKGINSLDDRLMPLLVSVGRPHPEEALPPSQQQDADSIVHRFQQANGLEPLPVIELLGHDTASKQLVAAQATASLGLNLYTVTFKSLISQGSDLETFTWLWQRESTLLPLALYIATDDMVDAEKMQLRRFLERSSGVFFLDLEEGKSETGRNRFAVEISKPSPEEQEQIWMEELRERADGLPQRLAEQFSFGADQIRRLARLNSEQAAQTGPETGGDLWQLCRLTARSGMEQLARRIDVKADWQHLVLPVEQETLLRQITGQVGQRNRVYDDWGFRQQMNRGLGINALFTGESGTGKTMAAEVIANSLDLDLFRIDLSSVVSKYIGETEKNLRKLFDRAEDSGAILFFDEADALFGKRSEVKDSHDRYANIEVNYLLQRIETYRGLAILASNVRTALDKAFVRRLRFIVEFPFPGVKERRLIWEKVFPYDTPLADSVDYDRLAKLNLTGGNIHNVALNAAFLAADEAAARKKADQRAQQQVMQQPPQENEVRVTMGHILAAACTEFRKLERPAKESDFKWEEKTCVEQSAALHWQQHTQSDLHGMPEQQAVHQEATDVRRQG